MLLNIVSILLLIFAVSSFSLERLLSKTGMLTIVPLSGEHLSLLHRADARFLSGDNVVLRVTHKGFALEYQPTGKAEWRTVQPPALDAQTLLADGNTACFLAFADGDCAGQAIVRKGAYQLCDLLDIRVDSRVRRQGVATALLHACEDWARRAGCAGLRVETTDRQPVACLFLEKSGFVLGGVDKLRHAADPEQAKWVPAMRESVLMFYHLF